MTKDEFVDLLRTYGGDKETPGSLAFLAELIKWVAAVGDEAARGALSEAQAENLDATSVGVNVWADGVENAG